VIRIRMSGGVRAGVGKPPRLLDSHGRQPDRFNHEGHEEHEVGWHHRGHRERRDRNGKKV